MQSTMLRSKLKKPVIAPLKVLGMLMLVSALAGCGEGAPVAVAGLKGKIDASATTACGATQEDNNKIAKTTESGYQAGIWDRPAYEPNCKR